MTHFDPRILEAIFQTRLVEFNTGLSDILKVGHPQEIKGVARLWEAVEYAVLNGGKRIRPLLLIETALACGGTFHHALPAACAVELVHTQSLIHDDLPCMDNDDLRRGRPTLHKAYEESTAILVGDALISLAFSSLAQCAHRDNPYCTLPVLATLIQEFGEVTSLRGLVNGQFADIYYEGQPYTPDILDYIHQNKTGALFEFSVKCGAMLATNNQNLIRSLTLWGKQLGLAFQMVDDLLDIEGCQEQLGKTPGKDRAQQKATYPGWYGIAETRQQLDGLYARLMLILDELAEDLNDLDRLKQLTQLVFQRIR